MLRNLYRACGGACGFEWKYFALSTIRDLKLMPDVFWIFEWLRQGDFFFVQRLHQDGMIRLVNGGLFCEFFCLGTGVDQHGFYTHACFASSGFETNIVQIQFSLLSGINRWDGFYIFMSLNMQKLRLISQVVTDITVLSKKTCPIVCVPRKRVSLIACKSDMLSISLWHSPTRLPSISNTKKGAV